MRMPLHAQWLAYYCTVPFKKLCTGSCGAAGIERPGFGGVPSMVCQLLVLTATPLVGDTGFSLLIVPGTRVASGAMCRERGALMGHSASRGAGNASGQISCLDCAIQHIFRMREAQKGAHRRLRAPRTHTRVGKRVWRAQITRRRCCFDVFDGEVRRGATKRSDGAQPVSNFH